MFDAIQIINTDPNVARRGSVAVNAGAGYVHVNPDQHTTFTAHQVYNPGCPRIMYAVEYDRYMTAGGSPSVVLAAQLAALAGLPAQVSALGGVPGNINLLQAALNAIISQWLTPIKAKTDTL